MREHQEFQDVLPAYIAIFENCEYRTYDVPDRLNDILRLYQVYYRDVFYCGLPEAEDKLLTALRRLLDMPDAEEALLAGRLQALFEAGASMRCSGKPRGITARISGGKRFRPSTGWSCQAARRSIPSIS